jgi:2-methylcitrate dehydratase PrpD
MTDQVASASDRAGLGDGFTARVAAEVMSISSRKLSERVLERTYHAVLDWLGVTIYGARNESAKIAQQFALFEGGNPVSRIIGTPHKVTARQAALASGIASHSNDYDDMGIGGHPSVCVLPAAFAVADAVGADGRSTVDAILQGYEAMKVISAAVGNSQYGRGFHSTSTFGAFGATAAVARLLELDLLQLERAFGIAATQAAGLKASFGTMCKHMNAGNAAAVGVLSAYLAKDGYTGATNVIEAPQGFARAHNDHLSDFDPEAKDSFIGERLGVEQIMYKPYAACGGTHSAIAGVQVLKAEHQFSANDVESAEVLHAMDMNEVCNIPEPNSGTEGMFSVRYTVALALVGESFTPISFTDAKMTDPDLVAVRNRVRIISREDVPVNASRVTIKLKSGQILETTTKALIVTPDEELPRQRAQLEEKYRDLVDPILGSDRAEQLLTTVRRIETLNSITELTDLTAAKE